MDLGIYIRRDWELQGISCIENGTPLNISFNNETELKNYWILKSKFKLICFGDNNSFYLKTAFDRIAYWHRKLSDAGIIVFMAIDKDGLPIREYFHHVKQLNEKSFRSINLSEVTFKREMLEENELFFHNIFGSNTKFKEAETFVFLTSAMRKGTKIYFVPETIVGHEKELNKGISNKINSNYSIGAAMCYLYGYTYVMAYLGHVMQKIETAESEQMEERDLSHYMLEAYIKGAFDFQLLSDKKKDENRIK